MTKTPPDPAATAAASRSARKTTHTSDRTSDPRAPLATPAGVAATDPGLSEELLEQVDLCHLLKLSRSTIYRLRLQQKFPDPIVIANVVRWRASDVAKWLAAQPTVSVSDAEIAELS